MEYVRSAKKMWIVTLCGLCLVVTLVGCEVVRTSSKVSPAEVDGLIWKYLLDKYSTSGDSLSPADLATMVRTMNQCKENEGGSKSLSSSPTVSCSGISLLDSDALNPTFSNLSSLSKISHKLLFFADNPACCDSKLVVVADNPIHRTHSDSDLLADSNTLPGTMDTKNKREKPTSGEVWGYGVLCVTLISMCSLAGVSVMPFMKKEFYKHLLTALVGLAVGSLTGSAVFHLIPQAFQLSDNDPSHDYLFIALMVCGGIWMFFMLERILKFIMDYKDRKDNTWNREKIPSVISSTSPENSAISMLVENGNCLKISELDNRSNGNIGLTCASPSEPEVIYECQEQAIKASFGHQERPRPRLTSFHDHSIKFEQGKDSVIATVAYMIIFGDGLHNFIDGLSIGAAFNESILTGVSISMAVFCEELPHELGDFAVLLNAGMSIRQALTYNFLSACTCYVGMAVGILLGEIEASTYIFALAGGMFLYIALVDMVPEMNEIAEQTSKISVKKGMWVLFLQNIGMFAGITALFLLAKYQDNIQF